MSTQNIIAQFTKDKGQPLEILGWPIEALGWPI